MGLLSSKEIGERIHLSAQTVRRYAREGVIPFVMTKGGHRRYDPAEVARALEMAESYSFEPLDSLTEPQLVDPSGRQPLQLAASWRPTVTRSMLAEAEEADERFALPPVGVPGSARFVLGQGAKV